MELARFVKSWDRAILIGINTWMDPEGYPVSSDWTAVVLGSLEESSVVTGSTLLAQLGARGMWMESCC